MKRVTKLCCTLGLVPLAMGAASAADIGFPQPRIFPESITVTRGGDLFVSDAEDGTIWHAKPGAAQAEMWLAPAKSGMAGMLGVVADEKSLTLWACGRPRAGDTPEVRDQSSALFAFDLATKAPKGRWQMPDGAKAACNDMAIGRDGAVYIAETSGGRIVRLKPGASALDVWLADPRLAGIDGIAFDRDGTLFVSTISTSRVFRLPLDSSGNPGTLVEMTLSRPLVRPDAMRFVAPGRFLFGENSEPGGITEGIVKGDRMELRSLAGGRSGTTSAVAYRGRAFGVVAKLNYRSPAMAGQDPGPFAIYSVPFR